MANNDPKWGTMTKAEITAYRRRIHERELERKGKTPNMPKKAAAPLAPLGSRKRRRQNGGRKGGAGAVR